MLLAKSKQRIGLSFLTSLVMLFMIVSVAHSRNGYLSAWNTLYPDSASDNNASCQLCYASGGTGNLNPYGKAICNNLSASIGQTESIQAVEITDSEADPTGFSNITEINACTQQVGRLHLFQHI